MVAIDRKRCCYCGACVSVCPVDALDLQETRLVVSDDCTACNQCLPACPTGALFPDADVPSPQLDIKDHYEAVVVGAGPAGSVAAWEAAGLGLSVLLVEKRQEIGSPVRCAEGLTPGALHGFVEPDPSWISARVRKAEIAVVQDGRDTQWEPAAAAQSVDDSGVGLIVERRVFDRALAERAAAAGACVALKTSVTGLLQRDGKVVGLQSQWAAREAPHRR